MTYGKVSESLPFVPLIFPPLIPSCTTQEGGAGGGGGRGGGGVGKPAAQRLVLVRAQAFLRVALSQFSPDSI